MATSYNGWPASPDASAIGVTNAFNVHGADFPGGMKTGAISVVFGYLVDALHTRVEPMDTDPSNGSPGYGAWGYSYRDNVNNPGSLSCHASGSAIDYNAPRHPNGTSTGPSGGGGWSGDQYVEVCEILDEICGALDWLTSNDPMHFEADVDPATMDQIASQLPAGGGGTTPTPGPEIDMASTASALIGGQPHIWAVGKDKRIYEQWPDPAAAGGWSGWAAGVPGDWSGGLSVIINPQPQLWGVAGDGKTFQTVWSDGSKWNGPVPWTGIESI